MRNFILSSVSVLALLGALPALAQTALADEIEATSKIDAVTLFPDAAKITRIAQVDLPAGVTKLVLHGLPASLDPASLRVSALSTGKIELGAVDSRPATTAKTPDTALDAKLLALRTDRASLAVILEALNTKKAMIERFAQAGPERPTNSIEPDKWNATFDQITAAMTANGEDIRQTGERIATIDRDLQNLDPARRPLAAPARDVVISLSSEAAAAANIALSYSIGGAGWLPLYDAKFDSAKRALDLARRASVHQRTGEDWADVDLTLSTTRTARGTAAPEVVTQNLNFFEPLVVMDAAKPMSLANAPAPMAKAVGRMDAAAAPMAEAIEVKAKSELSPFSAAYHLAGRFSVPSDSSQKTVLIDSKTLTPKITLKAAPALDPTAFIDLSAANEFDGPLLPGTVSLVRDDTFIGKGQIKFTEGGDSFTLGFGADDKVKIIRAPVKKKENEPVWYNQTKTETREFKTSVKNLHDFPVSVQIIDRIPVSENTSISVEPLPLTTPPTEKQVGDKRGVMSWTLELAPNESKDIRLAYRLKYPADREITTSP